MDRLQVLGTTKTGLCQLIMGMEGVGEMRSRLWLLHLRGQAMKLSFLGVMEVEGVQGAQDQLDYLLALERERGDSDLL